MSPGQLGSIFLIVSAIRALELKCSSDLASIFCRTCRQRLDLLGDVACYIRREGAHAIRDDDRLFDAERSHLGMVSTG